MLRLDIHRTVSFAHEGAEKRLRNELRSGALIRVRHGAYVDGEGWHAAKPEERARTRTRAHAGSARQHPPVYFGISAAAEWELPLFRVNDEKIHTIESGPQPSRSRADVIRHAGVIDDDDVVDIGGLRVTSLSRTVFDVIRTVSLEAAVACFDAALRKVAWRGWGDYDHDAAEDFRQAVQLRIEAAGGARGIRQARIVTAFADGRAQLPGESVSRLWMHQLDVPAPELQLAVALPHGRRAFPDFSWPRLRRFGEYDGEGKYLDPALAGGHDVRGVLRAQRAREGEIVAATGWAPVRWGMERLSSREVFARFLRAQRLLA